MGGIIGGHTHLDPVTLEDLYPVLLHPTGQHPSDDHIIITFNLHGSTTQNPGHDTFQLDQIVSTQWSPLPFKRLILLDSYCH